MPASLLECEIGGQNKLMAEVHNKILGWYPSYGEFGNIRSDELEHSCAHGTEFPYATQSYCSPYHTHPALLLVMLDALQ